MSHELICTWLKIPADSWPPDHYTLLGLEAAESDPARIEQHVHQRHECLLRYQLTHPEQVTEAMNRLAQAFNCLSDPAAKKAYDTTHFPDRVPAPPPAPTPPPAAPAPPPVEPRPLAATPDPLAWLYGPWSRAAPKRPWRHPPRSRCPRTSLPIRRPPRPWLVGFRRSAATDAPSPAATAPEPPPPATELEAEDPVVELAAFSAPARRGLGSKLALYYRISPGASCCGPGFRSATTSATRFQLTKKPDAIDLVRQLGTIRQLLQGFPPLLGQAGQPGYLVIALARQQMIVQTFLALLPSQREALVRDWQEGLKLLAAHRRFLRDELWALHRKGWIGRSFRVMRALVTDQPGLWLVLLALLAANLAYPLPVPALGTGPPAWRRASAASSSIAPSSRTALAGAATVANPTVPRRRGRRSRPEATFSRDAQRSAAFAFRCASRLRNGDEITTRSRGPLCSPLPVGERGWG